MFANADYWDKRFKTEINGYEWLLDETCFDEELYELLQQRNAAMKNVMHIGPGTSMLSFHLAKVLPDDSIIHNVDFSRECVDWGQLKELELFRTTPAGPKMRWSQANLLDLTSMLSSSEPGSIDLFIDKGTADAIACGNTITMKGHEETKFHPLYLLALHLALIATAGARWLTMSYSEERFPFLTANPFSVFKNETPSDFPDVNKLWKLVRKKVVQTEEEVDEKYMQKVGGVAVKMTRTNQLASLSPTQKKVSSRSSHSISLCTTTRGKMILCSFPSIGTLTRSVAPSSSSSMSPWATGLPSAISATFPTT